MLAVITYLSLPFPLNGTRWIARPQGEGHSDTLGIGTFADADFDTTCAADGGALWAEMLEVQRTARDRRVVWRCQQEDQCWGIGNQMRGIAVAFLNALISGRAFSIQWEHNGLDLASILTPRWQFAELESSRNCKQVNCWSGDCKYLDLFEDEAPCIITRTNSVPSVWWAAMMEKRPDAIAPLRKALHNSDFLMGCALRILFDFTKVLAWSLSSRSAPSNYVAVHMRMGDEYLSGQKNLWIQRSGRRYVWRCSVPPTWVRASFVLMT